MRESKIPSFLANTAARSSKTNSEESECRLINPTWITALVEEGTVLKPTHVETSKGLLQEPSLANLRVGELESHKILLSLKKRTMS